MRSTQLYASGSDPSDPYNAYIDKSLTVKGAPDGPLKGLAFAVKDLFDALLDAGATLRGKTHMDELAYSLNGENIHYGTPINPAAPGRIPGGSSSGSASWSWSRACIWYGVDKTDLGKVAVAAGDVPVALGSDTGGSVRVPAAYCGLYGIRPTWARTSLAGARPLAPSFDTAGW
ncbi:hypothetical protein VOLCADRAFT_87871 [Volvox carteri f. nagariensis]|uniref:Amidase domain-containing protein n=1 Tax=Volvox carteri f. nagariensis TaxID=3068 RepID=D8TMG5_VOLCA|nr:uncharacterized protein VOLCADRAFT_87871 [Volvox carteri f. nagariensis]EFJ51250.1 hypothetical protein VOLCADRAFT_87871 [Volvox carteri f. nagariensis]|eukprot:XP_002947717.1 hypothetical protein VOLCADRAFT_87871 [Volvox carteri f. nagariensis]